MVSLLFTMSLALCLLASHAEAAVVTWDDGAANDNWSATAPDNWNIVGTPGTGDTATFANTGASTVGVTTNVVDIDFTVQGVSYENTGANFHTTEIAATRTLTLSGGNLAAGFNVNGGNIATDANLINGAGALQLGGASPINIYVGRKTVSVTGFVSTGALSIDTSVDFNNVGDVIVGQNTVPNGSSGASGVLDLSGATLVGGTAAMNNLRIGTDSASSGTVIFGSSLTDLDIAGSLLIGAKGGFLAGGTGTLTLPTGANVSVGSAGASELLIGEKTLSGGDVNGALVVDGNFSANLTNMRIGTNSIGNGSATGSLDLGSATIVGGVLSMNTLEVGRGYSANGTLTLPGSLTDLNINGGLTIGGEGQGAAGATGVLNLASGTNVAVGISGNSNLLIGHKSASQGLASGSLTVDSANFSANLANVHVGTNRITANGSANGTLDLSNATIVGGTLAMDNLLIGSGFNATGSVSFNNTLTDLVIRNELHVGGGPSTQSASGVLNLATGTNVSIGTVTAGDLLLGEKSGSGGAVSGGLTVDGGTTSLNVLNVFVGVNNAVANGNATGTLDLSNTTLLSSSLVVNKMYIGSGFAANGTVSFNSSLTDLEIQGGLRLGGGPNTQGASGVLNLNPGTNVRIGTVAPENLLIAEKPGSGGAVSGDLTLDGDVSLKALDVRVGYNIVTANGSADGVLDLSNANIIGGPLTMSSLTIGVGRFADGIVSLPEGKAQVNGNVTVGDVNTGSNFQNGSGLLELDGTQMTVTGSVLIDVSGDVTVNVNGNPAGLILTDSSVSALDIQIGGTMTIDFTSEPDMDFSGPYFGLSWAGDHVSFLESLEGTQLFINTSGLSSENASLVDIYFEGGTTYVGFQVDAVPIPEPSSLMLLGWSTLGLLGYRRHKTRARRTSK